MRGLTCLLIAITFGAACSDGGSDAAPTTAVGSNATASTVATTLGGLSGGVPHPCQVLEPEDFADASMPIIGAGVDLSARIGLATDESAACQWTGDGTWDLLVGTGGGARAYEFDRGFFDELDDVSELAAGDAGYILDREESATPEDYDHEAGVLIGDLYFTLGTTDDDGAQATEQLALLVAERLAAAGSSG